VTPPARRSRRDEVTEALVDAAVAMVRADPEAELSGREVAARAGVNHGLVHRYFGTRLGLLRSVLDRLADELSRRLADEDPRVLVGLGAADTAAVYAKVLARALLDGLDPAELQTQFPTVVALESIARDEHGLDDLTARLAAAQCVALILGWQVFEPWLRVAADLDDLDAGEMDLALRSGSRALADSLRPGLDPPA
jgi:AcrR family transcriptional regulator